MSRSFLRTLSRLPFRLRLERLWPRTYLSFVPDRYSLSLARYKAEGGTLDPADARKFVRNKPVNNRGDFARYYFLNLVIDQIRKEGIRGDVAELGVFTGSTAVLVTKLARLLGTTAYLFDTFEGFDRRDLDKAEGGAERLFARQTLDMVRDLVGEDAVRFVKGRFPDTVEGLDPALSFCLVHLDCDVYAPFRAGLDYFYPRLVTGGFLVMHDYSSLQWSGAERAVDEFFADKPEKIVPIPDKSGTAVVRKV